MSGGDLPAPGNDAPATLSSLSPGLRFDGSDEELISNYLKRKVLNKSVPCDMIGEVDIYQHEPSDLAELSKLKTEGQEWFFFSSVNKTNETRRQTKEGYWKTIGYDREIHRTADDHLIGMIKTLVYYKGRAPYGLRTNWLIYEYRLVDNDDDLQIDAFVLCRVCLKKHTYPNLVDPNSSNEIQHENKSQSINEEDSHPRRVDSLEQDHDETKEDDKLDVPLALIRRKLRTNGRRARDMEKKMTVTEKQFLSEDEPLLKRNSTASLPPCVLNKEAPFPFF